MPRPPRIDFPGAVYHVTSRGNGRAEIFHSDGDRERFLAQLAQHLHLCAVDLYAFVLMENHFHLLCRTPCANLSRFMQRLLSSYALYSRYKHRRPGHLFQGRFKAKLVEDEVYLLAVTRYIHLNPLKIAACRRLSAQQRLGRLEAYAWSSYGGYAAAAKAQEFVNYNVLREYGRDLTAARRQYRAYVQACLLEDDVRRCWRRWPPAGTPSAARPSWNGRSNGSNSGAAVACRIMTWICRGGRQRWKRSMRPWLVISVPIRGAFPRTAAAPGRLRRWRWSWRRNWPT